MGRPDGQQNQAQPPVQPTFNPNNNKARPPAQSTFNPTNNKAQPSVQPTFNPNNNGANINQTNVPIGTPVNYQTQNRWSSELFDCMNDSENALITVLVPCVTFGQIAEIIDEGATPCTTAAVLYGVISSMGACFVYSYMFRTRMRIKYGLPEAPAPDWITHLICMQCALCQEYRELKQRGFDPVIGWAGNVQAQQQLEMMAPPIGQRMMG